LKPDFARETVAVYLDSWFFEGEKQKF